MSDHHHHHDHSRPIAIGATAARVVVGLLVAIGIVVVVATIALWPDRQQVEIPLPMQNADGSAVVTEAGKVIRQDLGACGSSSIGRVFDGEPQPPAMQVYDCQRSLIVIESGPHEGKHTLLEIAPGPGQPDLAAGDDLRIVRQSGPDGTPLYSFDDYARGLPLSLIVLAFVVVIVAVARWRGVRALLGLVFAFAVLIVFLLPALLDGKPAIPVALVAGSLILYAVLYLAHGVNLRTSSALLGTLTSMVVAAVLSWLTIEATALTGLSEEQNTNVATYIEQVSITGLLLAGFIIGSLGVLNDVTITQASAAFELAELDKKATRREVFTAAMRVGRDHIASTVYTLVLAYAGGALPLLLLFSVAGRPIRDVLVGDAVAIEIARSAVGGICLALSVPLTTGIAVMLARPFGNKPGRAGPARRSAVSRRSDRTRSETTGTHRKVPRAGAGSEGGAAHGRSGRGYQPWPTTGEQPRVQRPGSGDQRPGPRSGETPAARGGQYGPPRSARYPAPPDPGSQQAGPPRADNQRPWNEEQREVRRPRRPGPGYGEG
ncbi:hypothetical protein GCM10011588_66600 [Nocardia jinanensis]|uniref:YibE/F family protein n=1 Tax=Nocardia jinanensis TaxID=382504 RepID=A0A917VXY3_9NOCA|nr:hypothetical protein GCM10011588_66600 [Nocardia jinanensis]